MRMVSQIKTYFTVVAVFMIQFVQTDAICERASARFVSRSQWGAAEPDLSDIDPLSVPVCGVFIHHSAGCQCSTERGCKARMMQIQSDQMNLKDPYADIGYTFAIDEYGKIYEGRGWEAKSSQAKGNNDWSYGVVFIGTFIESVPNEEAFVALDDLLSCGVALGFISSNYRLFGHRDGRCTECPGDALYARIRQHGRYSYDRIPYWCCNIQRSGYTIALETGGPSCCKGNDNSANIDIPAPTCGQRNEIPLVVGRGLIPNEASSDSPPSNPTAEISNPHASCKELADSGDCEFYRRCVHSKTSCDETTGYPMAYGYKFCNLAHEQSYLLEEEAREWSSAVQICLMQELLGPIYNGKLSCTHITETALNSFWKCFTDTGRGICNIPDRKDTIAVLSTMFVPNDENFRKHWQKAWDKINLSFWACLKKGMSVANIKSLVKEGYCAWWNTEQKKLEMVIENPNLAPYIYPSPFGRKRRSAEGVTEALREIASSGDCKFWEVLEEGYPCKQKFGRSFTYSVLLPVCTRFERYRIIGPTSTVGQWMHRTQRCLMMNTLYMFNNESLDCFESDHEVMHNMVSCMVEAGFCDLTREDEFFLDRGLSMKGYPTQISHEYMKYPLTNKTQLVDTEYFSFLGLLRELLVDANYECYQRNERPSPDLYEMVYSPTFNVMMKMRIDN